MFPISTSVCQVLAGKTQMNNTMCLTVAVQNFHQLQGPVCITTENTCRTVEMRCWLHQIHAQSSGTTGQTKTWSSSGNLAEVTSQLVGVGYNVVTTTVVGESLLVIMQLRSDLVTGPVNM